MYAMAPHSFRNSQFLFLLCSFLVLNTTLAHSNATILCHDHERSALLHFKQTLSLNNSVSRDSTAYPKTESWKATGESDCCYWDGVECNLNTGYVIGLHLTSSFLYGTLPSSTTIFSLVHLQTLNLADNDFRNSPVPPEITKLSSLSTLNLSFSGFSGQIPLELSGLFMLTSLDLFGNYLYGDFPIDIFHLPDLLVLNVSYNENLTGYFPEFKPTSSLRALELVHTNFSGNLPASIGNLQELTILRLGLCKFSGTIPTSIGLMAKLTSLDLFLNNLYGDFPIDIFHLPDLLVLNVAENRNLKGFLPEFNQTSPLRELELYYTNFSGNLPASIGNLQSLTILRLGGCKFSGSIPASIGNLTQLTYLSLFSNMFNKSRKLSWLHKLTKLTALVLVGTSVYGNIPPSLANLTQLTTLYLGSNHFVGEIPHWIWNSDHLEDIDVSDNLLTGFEQNPIALQSRSLRAIDISHNMLQGNLPTPPPNTIMYSVSNNRLTGDITPMIRAGMSLKILDLSNNNMSGPIPQRLTNSLEALILHHNNFSGTIPQTYPKQCNLKFMQLNQNQLTGEIPKSLSNCRMLQILDLSNNQMEQSFPIWLGTLPQLQVLLLHSNKFHGAMGSPRFPSEFPMLRIIDLSHNSLIGNLPVGYIQIWNAMKIFSPDMELYIFTYVKYEIQSIQYIERCWSSITLMNKGVRREYIRISNILTAIDLSSNKFTGQIPQSFGSLEALQSLNLSNNELTGPIPTSLVNLRQLESLDLSQNKLSGIIPQQLAAQLNFLAFFNVSCNLLSGRIPQSQQFKTFDNNSYMMNSGLCGFPLSKNCGTVQSPPADYEEDDEDDNEFPSGFDWVFILAGVVSGLVVGFVIGNILTDRHHWLIDGIVQNFGGTQKKPRRQKRQIIWD